MVRRGFFAFPKCSRSMQQGKRGFPPPYTTVEPPLTRVGHTWCRAKAGVNAEPGGDRQDFPGWYGNPKALLQPKRLPSAAAQRRIRRNEAHGVGGLLAAPGNSLWDFHPKLETAPSRRARGAVAAVCLLL